MINNDQGAAVRTAGETGAVKMAFYLELEELNGMFGHVTRLEDEAFLL